MANLESPESGLLYHPATSLTLKLSRLTAWAAVAAIMSTSRAVLALRRVV